MGFPVMIVQSRCTHGLISVVLIDQIDIASMVTSQA